MTLCCTASSSMTPSQRRHRPLSRLVVLRTPLRLAMSWGAVGSADLISVACEGNMTSRCRRLRPFPLSPRLGISTRSWNPPMPLILSNTTLCSCKRSNPSLQDNGYGYAFRQVPQYNWGNSTCSQNLELCPPRWQC